jgi:hypothetical protein
MSSTTAAEGSIKPTEYESTPFIKFNSNDESYQYISIVPDTRKELDAKKQSVDVGDGVRRNAAHSSALIGGFLQDEKTVYDMVKNVVARNPDRQVMGYRTPAPAGSPKDAEAGGLSFLSNDSSRRFDGTYHPLLTR